MRAVRIVVALLGLLAFGGGASRVQAQDSSGVVTVQHTNTRPLRLVFSGGLAVPTGGFANYHELGTHGSASAVLRLFGQKLRLRPEVAYSQFGVLQQKVRALVASAQMVPPGTPMRLVRMPNGDVQRVPIRNVGLPKLPDLTKLRDGAISSMLGTFGNIELPLGPAGFQPYVLGGVGAMRFRTDVTTVGEAMKGVQWGMNVGAGLRFRLGPIGAGIEARIRDIPVDERKTFFKNVSSVPVAFSVVF